MRAARTFGRVLTVLLVIAAAGVGAYMAAERLLDVDLDARLFRSRTRAQSIAILQEARSLFALSTVEIIYNTVFPHDLVPADMDWPRLIEQREDGRAMSLQEIGYLEVYDLCLDIGIDLRRDEMEFVVVTAVVHGGFDLGGTVFAAESPDDEELRRAVAIGDDRVVTLRLPPVVVTDLVIEDERSGDYGYPDMDVGPEQWRRITEIIDEEVRERIIREGKLQTARQNGREFVRSLIMDLGYRDVIFRE